MAEIDNSMLAELEQESRLIRARNARLEAEVTVLTEMVRVMSDKLEKEREACESIEYELAKSPAMFATMAEYKAYKDGVQDYRTKIIARGEA
jgi:predicted  nucleic acid-binding Zn-ribbon protein